MHRASRKIFALIIVDAVVVLILVKSIFAITRVTSFKVGAFLVRSQTVCLTFVNVNALGSTTASEFLFVSYCASAIKTTNIILANGGAAVVFASSTLINIDRTFFSLETWTEVRRIAVRFADTGSLLPTLDAFDSAGSVAWVQLALICSDGPLFFGCLFIFRVDLSHLLSIANLLITLPFKIVG